MTYLLFDLVALLLPLLVLLRGVSRAAGRGLLAPAAVLAGVALAWTGPWDDHLVRTGVWSYRPDAVLARLGAVPAEEYAFVVLEVLLVAAWGLHVRRAPERSLLDGAARRRGAAAWSAASLVGAVLLAGSPSTRYLGLLLVWAAPPLALQHAVGGDVLAGARPHRLHVALPVVLWLCACDRAALGLGVWSIGAPSSTGLGVAGLPVEEGLFFALTVGLATDGLLLARDPRVLARLGRLRCTRSRGSAYSSATRPTGERRTALARSGSERR